MQFNSAQTNVLNPVPIRNRLCPSNCDDTPGKCKQ